MPHVIVLDASTRAPNSAFNTPQGSFKTFSSISRLARWTSCRIERCRPSAWPSLRSDRTYRPLLIFSPALMLIGLHSAGTWRVAIRCSARCGDAMTGCKRITELGDRRRVCAELTRSGVVVVGGSPQVCSRRAVGVTRQSNPLRPRIGVRTVLKQHTTTLLY